MQIVTLFKFGKREHLQQLRTGLLYMNPSTYFSVLEADEVRSDPLEGTSRIIQPRDIGSITLEVPSLNLRTAILPADLASATTFSLEKDECNVFCMFAVKYNGARTFGPDVDRRNFQFGDSFVVVTKPVEFVNRVKSAADAAGLKIRTGPVKYEDANRYSGITGPFWKSSFFAYQNEFRITASPASRDARKLLVGDLQDVISPICPITEINSCIFQI